MPVGAPPSSPDDEVLVPGTDGSDDTTGTELRRASGRRLSSLVGELRNSRRPRLDRVLTLAGGEDLSDAATQLSVAKDAIASMLRDIADVEALGDSTLQDHGAKAAAVRRLFTLFMNREPQANEDVGMMMDEIHRVREALVQREQDLISQEARVLTTRRDTELTTAQDANAHVANLEEAEIDGANDQHLRVQRLFEARTQLAERKGSLGVALRQTEDKGELDLQAQGLKKARAQRPLSDELQVIGQDALHAAALLKETGHIRLARAREGIAEAVGLDEGKKTREIHEANTANERNKKLSLYAMGLAQTVTGYLAAQGVHGMSLHPESLSSWIFPIGSSVALNGIVFVATSQYLRGNWNFRSNLGLAAMFAGAVSLTATSGYAGAAREMIPETVLADAVKDRVTTTADFVEDARPVVAGKFTSPANSLVLDMKQAGTDLSDEAMGKVAGHEYGFSKFSKDALKHYRVTINTAALGLASAGMCDDLRLMATDYYSLQDRFQMEYDHPSKPGAFGDAPFVRLDASGKKSYDMTFDSQISSCDAAYPLSPTELITSIDSDLTAIREGLNDGSIHDTPQLNEHIRKMNANLQKLTSALKLDTSKLASLAAESAKAAAKAKAAVAATAGGAPDTTSAVEPAPVDTDTSGLTAPDLKELEPMTYEALGLLVEHVVNFYEADWEHFSLKYPAMAVVATAIDQLGLILAFLAIATSKRVDEKNAAYIDSLSRVQKGEERVRGLLERLKARFKPADEETL